MSGMQSKIIQLEKENADLKEENADLKKKLEKDKLGKATQRVAFTADGFNGLAKQDDGTLVFKRVVNNEGKGYDAASGDFVAPVAGTYSFTASVTAAKAGGAVTAYIKSDDGGMGVGLCGTDTSTGSATATARLQAGGRVWVKTLNSADSFDGQHTSFSGALISPKI